MKIRLLLSTLVTLAFIYPVHADYCIVINNAATAAHFGSSKQCGYATPEAARAYAQTLGIDSSFYNIIENPDSSTPAPGANNTSGLTLQQQLGGLAAQQMAVNMNATPVGAAFGVGLVEGLLAPHQPSPQEIAAQQAQQQAQLAQQQAQQAAQQLNNSGIYYYNKKDYADAINEFSQALAETPNDTVIAQNLANARALLAKQQQDAATAARNSGALGQLLGNTPAAAAPVNNSPLSLVNLDSNPNVVDLSGTTKTYVDPRVVKGDAASQPATPEAAVQQLDSLLDNTSDQAKKALSDFADKYLPGSSEASGPGAQEQTAKTQQETKEELDRTLGGNQDTDAGSGGTSGIKGLPGIALNDNTGNGGNKPYGIPGLPGTYVNGPGEGSGIKQPDSSTGTTADSQASQTSTEPTTTETAAAPREQANAETAQPQASSVPETQPQTSGEAAPTVANNGASAPAQYNQQTVQMGVSPDKSGLTPLSSEPANSGAGTPVTSQSPALSQLSSTAGDTKGFDGGSGSTINTSANISSGAPNTSPNSAFGDMSDLHDAVAGGPGVQLLLPFHPMPPGLEEKPLEHSTTDESEDTNCTEGYAPIEPSGLSIPLQQAIIGALNKGDVIAVRPMAEGACELYEKNARLGPQDIFDPRISKVFPDGTAMLKNGTIIAPFESKGKDPTLPGGKFGPYRIVAGSGKIVLSDCDLGFVTQNGKEVSNNTALRYAAEINIFYGHRVCQHGDEVNGIRMRDEAALKIYADKGSEEIWYVFKRPCGWVDSGTFEQMCNKYLGPGWDELSEPPTK